MASNSQSSFREPTTRPAPRPPLDLTHHFSEATKRRTPSKIKQYYKYFLIPGIGNLAGGLPNAQFFPFDTLEAQTAQPERWKPTPNHPEPDWEADIDNDVPSAPTSGPDAGVPSPPDAPRPEKEGLHMTVPMVSGERDITRKVDVTTALQYGTAQGYPSLLSFVRQFTREHLHPNVPYAGGPEVILTCGSTDGFAKSIELLLDTWLPDYQPESQREGLLCEKFVYPNVLSQTAPKGVQPVPVEVDAEGMVASGPGGLEHVLAHWDSRKGKRPRIMYTVTMGHNPTSGVLSLARRKELYDICERYDVIIIEDDPYWYLQYPSSTVEEAKSRNLAIPEPAEPEPLEKSSGFPFLDSLIPSYLSIDTSGRVIRLDTFSKTVAPGCRLGWITAQPIFIDRLLRITESTTQQPSGFVQSMVANLVLGPQPPSAMHAFNSLSPEAQTSFTGWDMSGWVRWLAGLRGAYERRMNRMCSILDAGAIQLRQSTPSSPQDSDYGIISTTRLMSFPWPRGGMFLWLRVYFESHPLFGAPRPLLAKPCLSSTSGGWHPRTSAATAAGPGCPSTLSTNGSSGAPLHASQHFQVQRHRVVDGPALANALMLYLTRKPHLVLVSPGLMFSATDAVRTADGWRFFRLCFAAESEENVDACSHRFVAGLHKFWKIKKVEELEEILREVETREVTALLETLRIGGTLPGAANPGALGNLGWIGC